MGALVRKRLIAALVVGLWACMYLAGPSYAGSDTAPPVLTALSVSPGAVDVSSGSQVVTVTATITDDLAGVAAASCASPASGSISDVMLRSPSGNQTVGRGFACASGDTYVADVTINQNAEAGVWTVDRVWLWDKVSNNNLLDQQELAALGLAGTVEVASESDTAPPVLTALSVSPGAVDVSSGSQVVTVTATITDDLAGVAAASCASPASGSISDVMLRSPSGNQTVGRGFACASGDTYVADVTINQNAEAGVWTVDRVWLWDKVSNNNLLDQQELAALGLAGTVEVASESDTAPPVLTALSVSPGAVDVSSGSQVVTVTATITDDLAGVAAASCASPASGSISDVMLRSPSGNQTVGRGFACASGDTYVADVTINQNAEAGVWTVDRVWLWDKVSNNNLLDQQELAALGLAGTVVVSVDDDSRFLAVALAGDGEGKVTSSPEGIDCGTDCTGDFVAGSTVTITAIASPGSTFVAWSRDCSGAEPVCNVVMDSHKSVIASFDLAGGSDGSGSGGDPAVVEGSLTNIAVGVDARGRRQVSARLALKERLEHLAVRLTRSGKLLVSKKLEDVPSGTRVVRLTVPRTTRGGATLLRVVMEDEDGNRLVQVRRVRLRPLA